MRYLSVVFLAAALAVIAAAGATAAEVEETDAARTAESTAEHSASVRSCTGGRISLSADEKRMLDLHNKIRADRGLPRLCVHPALQRTARAHSKEMIERDSFNHGDVGSRLKRYGYDWRTYGENILYDPGSRDSVESLFKLWMKSSGHKANILEKSFREVGIGASSGDYKGGRATMWTADFGDR